jgi:hypothetical protein
MNGFFKKIICLGVLAFACTNFSYAEELTGGVSFDVDSARDYVQQDQKDSIKVNGPYCLQENNIEKTVYSYNTLGDVVGITVQYKGEPDTAYIYNKNKTLIYIDKYDEPINVYPHRGYRYNLDGQLVLSSLTVSKNEMFRFNPEGNLIAHSLFGVIYDENGKIIGTGK